ncbi:MAG: hypothetical protein ACI9WU_001818 [Myxococcota bacterium]|jgi:hypothetical protein
MSRALLVGFVSVVFLMVLPSSALAQDPPDPDEEDIFGDGDDTPQPPDFETKLAEQNDKLQIGGTLWMRSQASFSDSDEVEDHRLSFPNLVELYLDGRPSDRIRGFIKARLAWNPSIGPDPAPSLATAFGFEPTELEVVLDQLWLKFDIARALYVTIGQQAVRWGTTRIWNPIDVINTQFREPLTLFDSRTGVPMIKLHIPVESLGWNFYVLGMLKEVDTFDDAGIAARAEFVFSTVELGLVGAYRKGVDPRVGLDISAGVLDLDIKGEVGLRLDESDDMSTHVQASAGLEYGVKYSDQDTLYVGAEYFYNQDGGTTQEAFGATPLDLLQKLASGEPLPQWLYVGKHYAALYLSLPQPGDLDQSYVTLSSIANLTDTSFLGRLDWSETILTFMTLQMYVVGHWGDFGELRIGDKLLPGLGLQTQLIEVGLNLRIDL